ncbi:MAG: alpha/beta hydrolase [Proteobacteria bacterium]|nr:alpha/beta hydrolase [Pseudomonadota bacterium]MCP4922378.1 alpha/beta hydrolase [Pseudomonadota bacterium]
MLLALVASNGLVASHANAMLSFVPAGERTPGPEDLTGLAVLRTLVVGVEIPQPVSSEPNVWLGELATTTTLVPEPRGAVLMFHGYCATRDQLEERAVLFRELGYSTIAVDFAGHGHSPGEPVTTIGWREADDVVRAIDATYGPVGLYGFSMGSAAILRAVGELGAEAEFVISEAGFASLTETVGTRFQTMGLPAQPFASWLLFWGSLQTGFWAPDHEPQAYAAKISAPLLVVQGDQDLRVSLDEANRLGGELLVLEGVGHHMGAPDVFREGVKDFLSPEDRPPE